MGGVALMEKGFFHPSVGYWQTNTEPSLEILATYPAGTIEVPLKPGADFDWVDGVWQPAPPVPPSMDDYTTAIDAHVDATARSKGYNSAAHCASYIASTHAPWAAEAQAFVAWRDQVWLFVFQQLALVEAGTIPAPTSSQELIDTLPAIQWPEG